MLAQCLLGSSTHDDESSPTLFVSIVSIVTALVRLRRDLVVDTLPQLAAILDALTAIMMGLVGVSALIAGVGLVNLLTIGVVQRRRELGLLRALGVSNGQVRAMVLFEAAHITIAAVVTGLVLGIAYGWAGAQSLLGSVPVPPSVGGAVGAGAASVGGAAGSSVGAGSVGAGSVGAGAAGSTGAGSVGVVVVGGTSVVLGVDASSPLSSSLAEPMIDSYAVTMSCQIRAG